ncbi:type IX secretion system motor protein PorM/GldM [Flavobacterium psychrotolerans]|uniref:Gliding motility protein GldM n=1 Tax=Flavobacterium psychrotolerans TaxID=2169410 RepID=A0A2U1JG72_9FLAO|nr:gliding motility protein GldM [Flavobacterium psychrotolerans]PWA04140.1 gliding motility protein GldM [Flavobacterium psychrotolerans]
MAGGKLTPRQKMINLMYLVFISMLALNMSKEVLSAFGILNNKIVESNAITDTRNESSFQQLAQKASDQPGQYGDKKAKVEKLRAMSKEFFNFVEEIKTTATKKFPIDPKTGMYPCEQMDKSDDIDNMFYHGDKESPKAKAFLELIQGYPGRIKAICGSSIADVEMKKIEKRFATLPVYSEKAGANLPWLDYNFHHFPLIASVTKLTQLQADIKATESDVMTGMFQSDLVAAASLTAYQPIVVPEKTAFFQGEAVKGKIILGKFDPNLVAKSVIVNGTSVKATAGQADFSFGAGAIGEHEISGSFNFDENGKVVSLPIKGNYVVVPKPNSATISADKMNVVYRGVVNPMTISFAGISADKVTASAPGLSSAGKPGSFKMSPGQGTEVTINVTGTLPDNSKVSDKKIFRIKGIPGPTGTIRGEMGVVKGPKTSLAVSSVGAKLVDFDFEVGLDVVGFNLKVAGQPTVVVQGNKMNAQCAAVLSKAGRGDQVTISEIKTKLSGAGNYMLPRTAPVIYEIQ